MNFAKELGCTYRGKLGARLHAIALAAGFVIAGSAAVWTNADYAAANTRPLGPDECWNPLVAETSRDRFCGRLLFVSVGVDAEILYAASDAWRVAEKLRRDYHRLHFVRRADTVRFTADESFDQAAARERLSDAAAALRDLQSDEIVQGVVLTNADATLGAVSGAFAQVIEKARPNDVVVFYFGGVSRNVLDSSSSRTEHILNLTPGRDWNDEARLRTHGLSSEQLGRWLNDVTAERQLVMVEAGEGGDFLAEFAASIVETSPAAGRLTSRHRVILGPRQVGLEQVDWGSGLLPRQLERAGSSALQIFFAAGEVHAQLEAQAASVGRANYLRIFDEREFLQIYTRVAGRLALRNRGFESAAVAPRPPPVLGGRNIAVVIGTDEYDAPEWSRLVNPSVDARAVAEELRRSYGFEVRLLLDPSLETLLDTLATLRDIQFAEQDQLLVFIAGHGYYDGTMGFLVARDSKPLREDRHLRSYLSHNMLAQYLEGIPSKHILLVLDACFGGAFSDLLAAGSRSGDVYADRPLAEMVAERLRYRSRFYITSGGTEYVPDGRPNQHSPFARRFIGALRENASSSQALTISRLRAAVENASPTPRHGEFGRTDPGGDFILVPVSALARQ